MHSFLKVKSVSCPFILCGYPNETRQLTISSSVQDAGVQAELAPLLCLFLHLFVSKSLLWELGFVGMARPCWVGQSVLFVCIAAF